MAAERPLLAHWLEGRTPFDVVNGLRFPASALQRAAMIDGVTLTNYLSKTPIDLCSKSAGQGKSRQFCLIDVYQIALLARFARLTKRVYFIAKDLNLVLLEGVEVFATGRDWELKRLQMCEDVRAAPPVYHCRDDANPIFLYTDSMGLGLHAGPNPAAHDPLFVGGLILNATTVLRGVDVALAEFVMEQESKE